MPRSGNHTLLYVRFEFQLLFNVGTDTFHNTFSCTFTFHVNATVISIAYEAVPSSFQFFIQFIQNDIGK
ncbi:hypothetical protein D3C85_1635670 [compost metagenome]